LCARRSPAAKGSDFERDDLRRVTRTRYFEHQCVDETVMKDSLTMTFHGWTYTLEDYARALEEAGFLIECVREPVQSAEQATKRSGLEGWRRVPLFLFMRAVKR
jgi:hypothetical protein